MLAHQIEKRRNGFDLIAAQIERIEIEMQVPQKRRPTQGDSERPDHNCIAVVRKKRIDRGQELVADRFKFGRRLQKAQQGGQQSD